jgi:hypothetical protein
MSQWRQKVRLEIGKGIQEGIQHTADIYDAIWRLGRPTIREVHSYLSDRYKQYNTKVQSNAESEYKTASDEAYRERMIGRYIKRNAIIPISVRTIQRIIKKDNRIQRDGRHYFVNRKKQFETRYQEPKKFGDFVYMDFMDKSWPDISRDKLSGNESEADRRWLEFHMREMMTRLGVFMTMMFIEASKPFKDKTLNEWDRKALVDYWIQNAIPIDSMFRNVLHIMNHFRIRLGKDMFEDREGLAHYELDQKSITKLNSMIKRIHPQLYEEWINSVDKNKQQFGIRGKVL